MVAKNPLSKIRESLETRKLEKMLENVYGKYGEVTLKHITGLLEVLKEKEKISEDSYKRVLETLLSEDVIGFIDYIWEKYYKGIEMIPSLYTHGIINFARYIKDRDMYRDFIRVLKEYSDKFDKGVSFSELISAYMFYPPFYGTLLKEGDPRIPLAVKCTLDELLKEETKQIVREDNRNLQKIIASCAERAGFKPDYYYKA